MADFALTNPAVTNPAVGVHFSSARTGGSDCWATPLEIVDAVERDLGLRFVLDTACETHNAIVGGTRGDRMGFGYRADRGANGLTGRWSENVRTLELAGCHRERGQSTELGRAAAWCNPPYSEIGKWLARCAAEGQRCPIAALVPVRSDRPWWREFVMPRHGEERAEMHARVVWFIEGRIRFVGASNDAPFPSVIATWGPGLPCSVATWAPGSALEQRLELEND